jgi:general secretion pathway protein F
MATIPGTHAPRAPRSGAGAESVRAAGLLVLIAAGEQSARLGRMTERAAVLVESWLTNERKRVAALIDPLLMLVVGTMVLVIVLAILLPIFDLQGAIG